MVRTRPRVRFSSSAFQQYFSKIFGRSIECEFEDIENSNGLSRFVLDHSFNEKRIAQGIPDNHCLIKMITSIDGMGNTKLDKLVILEENDGLVDLVQKAIQDNIEFIQGHFKTELSACLTKNEKFSNYFVVAKRGNKFFFAEIKDPRKLENEKVKQKIASRAQAKARSSTSEQTPEQIAAAEAASQAVAEALLAEFEAKKQSKGNKKGKKTKGKATPADTGARGSADPAPAPVATIAAETSTQQVQVEQVAVETQKSTEEPAPVAKANRWNRRK